MTSLTRLAVARLAQNGSLEVTDARDVVEGGLAAADGHWGAAAALAKDDVEGTSYRFARPTQTGKIFTSVIEAKNSRLFNARPV